MPIVRPIDIAPEISVALVDATSIEITTQYKTVVTKEQLEEQKAAYQAHIDDIQTKADAQIASLQTALDAVQAKLDMFKI